MFLFCTIITSSGPTVYPSSITLHRGAATRRQSLILSLYGHTTVAEVLNDLDCILLHTLRTYQASDAEAPTGSRPRNRAARGETLYVGSNYLFFLYYYVHTYYTYVHRHGYTLAFVEPRENPPNTSPPAMYYVQRACSKSASTK